jgi:hypothetical protein
MSDAVGGASICVTNNVFDPYSHLKLTAGRHTLQGLAALEFVRSRHAFGDGSDLGRTYAQHLFLSAVIRNLKSTGVLANPATLFSLANAATSAVTVDQGLGSIPALLGLAADVDKVPTDRITFTTMPNQPDPTNPNRVVVAPTAQALFSTISNDQPLTNAKSMASAASGATVAPAATTIAAATIAVKVLNGSRQSGRAARVAAGLKAHGFTRATFGPAPALIARTTLSYPTGGLAGAQAVAQALRLPATAVQPGQGRALTLTIGSDWLGGVTFTTAPAPVSASRTAAALVQAHVQTANQSGSCAPVSTAATVALNGVGMTPTQAYARSSKVPNSAP